MVDKAMRDKMMGEPSRLPGTRRNTRCGGGSRGASPRLPEIQTQQLSAVGSFQISGNSGRYNGLVSHHFVSLYPFLLFAFIFSPILFYLVSHYSLILFPIIPLCCLPASCLFFLMSLIQLSLIIIFHYIYILSTIIASSCLRPWCLALLCFPLSLHFVSCILFSFSHFVSHPLHLVSHYRFILSPIILSLPMFV